MLRKLVLFFCLVASQNVLAVEALHTFNIVLLQPDSILQKRIPDVSALSTYIKAIEKAVTNVVQSEPAAKPIGGFIVVAVKLGRKSNIWLDFKPKLKAQTADKIQLAAKSIQPILVNEGVVVFAIKVGLWGGQEPTAIAPSPREWKAAAKKAGHPLETGNLVEMIWRE